MTVNFPRTDRCCGARRLFAWYARCMGRQVNFWMDAADEQEFVERLGQDDCVWSPYHLPIDQRPAPLEFDDWTKATPKRISVVRRADWKALRFTHIHESLLPEYGSKHRFAPWTRVGSEGSASFEWSRCIHKPRAIHPGRIYLDTSAPEFATQWFNRLRGWLRRKSARKDGARFVMSGAAEGADSGRYTLDPTYAD